jgi:2-succinyl-5-enolpyruvyl-6-hydroxy-3-cyclohexene-1-carboxylate synthase
MTLITQVANSPLATSNAQLAKQVLEEVISQGVYEFCLCPGARNAPLFYPLVRSSHIQIYYWPEERSAAFFALGRIKATGRPIAVVTTSGTAAAELLPAAMEAHYTGLPLVLMTADRPRRFRGTGAPQSAEQVGLFSCYAHEMQDLAEGDKCHLDNWKRQGPIHLNLCFEEPTDCDSQTICLGPSQESNTCQAPIRNFYPDERFLAFLKQTRFPLVVVGALPSSLREAAIHFLLHLNAPVYAEGISGIREEPRLEPLRIKRIEHIWSFAEQYDYPIDGILRLGGVPTARLWRDLENKSGQISICSISENPFSGLSWADIIHTPLAPFFAWAHTLKISRMNIYSKWKRADHAAHQALLTLFKEEPLAEASLIHALSAKIPIGSKIYLGNSLPIREWDQAATYQSRGFQMACNRGVNGIDGQMATFLGYCSAEQENWSILGDLTVLYDLVAPWITSQLSSITANVVLVNNGGAGIFARMFASPAFQNRHELTFEPFAQFWGWHYERWNSIPECLSSSKGGRIIELVPNSQSTERFLEYLKEV